MMEAFYFLRAAFRHLKVNIAGKIKGIEWHWVLEAVWR